MVKTNMMEYIFYEGSGLYKQEFQENLENPENFEKNVFGPPREHVEEIVF